MTISVTPPTAVPPTRTTLQEQSAIILHPESSYGDLFAAVSTLYTWFSQITAVREDRADPTIYRDTFAASGKLISPLGAARCMGDGIRTARFLQGVHAALLEAQQRFPDACIEVLYAGSGPFATLLLPLFPWFRPDQIRVTMIDIHQESLDAVAHLLTHFDLTDYVDALILGDATTYIHPTGRRFHVLVTETMQKALAQEPQVAITLHLVDQLHADGLLVPEEITVRAVVADMSKEFAFVAPDGSVDLQRARVDLGPLMTLNRTTAQNPSHLLAPVTVHIPMNLPPTLATLILCTHIITFGSHTVDDYECGLTYPTVLTTADLKGGMALTFAYALDATPGFRLTSTPAAVDHHALP